MIQLSPELRAALASTANQPVDLYELHLDSQVHYFSDRAISWGGHDYLPYVVSRSSIRRYDGGQFDQVQVTLSNVDTSIAQLLLAGGIEGRRLVIRKVDVNVPGDSLVLFNGVMDRPSDIDEETASITAVQLLGSLDHEVPSRRFTTFCPWRFKSYECGYAGGESECNKSWARCSELGNTNRFGGFRFVPHSGSFQYQEVERKRFMLLFSRKKTVTKTATFNAVDDTPYEVPIPLVLGRAQIAGIPIQYVDEGGETKILAALAAGSCSNITYIRANGHLVASATGHLGQLGGTGSQLVDPRFPQGYPYNLLCYVGVTVPSDVREEDPAPVIDCVLLGALADFYNSSGQWTGFGWTDNPVWLTIWFLRLSLAQGGMGFPESWIDFGVCAETAAYCDELIPDTTNDQKIFSPPSLPGSMVVGDDYQRFQSTGVDGQDPLIGGPYEDYVPGVNDDTNVSPAMVMVKRFTMNGVIGRAEKAVDVLFKKLLPAFRGYITFSKDGKLQIRTERPVANTAIAAPTAAGATQIAVGDSGVFAVGNLVLVGVLTAAAEVRQVSQIESGVLHFAVPLEEAHAAGEQIHLIHRACDDSNTIGKISYPLSDRQASTNRVTVKYVDAPAGFETREVWVNDYEHQAQVNRVNNEEVDGAMIDSYFQAWRIGQWARAKARDLGRFVSLRANIGASPLEIGDIITVSSPEHGLKNVPFRVIEIGFEPDDEVTITGQLYALGVYDDSAPQATVGVPGVFRPIPSASASETGPPSAPTNVTMQIIDSGNEYVARVLWSRPVTEGGTSGYQINLEFAADEHGNEVIAEWGFGNQTVGYLSEQYQYSPARKLPVASWVRSRVAGYNPLGHLSMCAFSGWYPIGAAVDDLQLPTQPGGDGWSVVLGPTQRHAQTGEQRQRLDVNISARPANVTHFSVWVYPGSTPPAGHAWGDPFNARIAEAGDTQVEIWVPRGPVSEQYQITVTGSSERYTLWPGAGTPVKTVTVPAIAPALTPTSWSIAAEQSIIAGQTWGRYVVTGSLPADVNRDHLRVERRWTSPGWSSPKSDWFEAFGPASLPYSQVQYEWKWPEDEWLEWRLGVVNHAGTVTWHGTVVQLHLSGGGTVSAAALDQSTMDDSLGIVGGQLAGLRRGLVINGDFSAGQRGWTFDGDGSSIITGVNAYFGNSLQMTPGESVRYVTQMVSGVSPGQVVRMEVFAWSNLTGGTGQTIIQFLDAGYGWLHNEYANIPGGSAWDLVPSVKAAPANTAHVQIIFVVPAGASGNIRIDNVSLTTQEPLMSGGGLQRSNIGVEIEPGALGNLQKYTSTVRPLPIVASLPSLPSTDYPANSFVVLSTNGRLYRNISGAWVGTPAEEIVTGVLGASVVYAGTITAGQVSAGAFAGLKLILNLNGVTTRIENQFESDWGGYVGLSVTQNATGRKASILPSQVAVGYPATTEFSILNERQLVIQLGLKPKVLLGSISDQTALELRAGSASAGLDVQVQLAAAGSRGTLNLFAVGASGGGVYIASGGIGSGTLTRVLRERLAGTPGSTSWQTQTGGISGARLNFDYTTITLGELAAVVKMLLYDLQQHHGLI